MSPRLHLLPGALGAAATLVVWQGYNAAGLAREIEGAVAVICGLAVWGIASYAVPRILMRESEIEKKLAEAGLETDAQARRALTLAEEARDRLDGMTRAARDRTDEVKGALAALVATMEALFWDMVTSPETARRADDLLRRTLPRLEQTFLEYCRYARKGDGIVDTEETRARMIEALDETATIADRARREMIASEQEQVGVSLSVLEGTLAHPR